MSKVTELGYMGLSVSNLDAWKDYAAGIVGMETARGVRTWRVCA